MTNCIGIFGKLFGHRFDSKIIERSQRFQFNNHFDFGTVDKDILQSQIDLQKERCVPDKYKIICTRCGEEK